VDVGAAGVGVSLVVVATPDAAINDVARAIAPQLEPGALVVHLAGAVGLDALDPITEARADVDVGALHPLQTLASPDTGAMRLAGSWAAVAGSPRVTELASELALVPFTIDDSDRAAYHAAASVASNHLVALLGQVERIASSAHAPFAAFEPLVRAAVDNTFALGPAAALTGPSRQWVSTPRSIGTAIPKSCPVARHSVSAWPEPWGPIPMSSSWTSLSGRSTR
jgi:predicted short-subunit dehydrogenase-like oxidoreductase (DUF2520 family)